MYVLFLEQLEFLSEYIQLSTHGVRCNSIEGYKTYNFFNGIIIIFTVKKNAISVKISIVTEHKLKSDCYVIRNN